MARAATSPVSMVLAALLLFCIASTARSSHMEGIVTPVETCLGPHCGCQELANRVQLNCDLMPKTGKPVAHIVIENHHFDPQVSRGDWKLSDVHDCLNVLQGHSGGSPPNPDWTMTCSLPLTGQDNCGTTDTQRVLPNGDSVVVYYNEMYLYTFDSTKKKIIYGCQVNLTCKYEREGNASAQYFVGWPTHEVTRKSHHLKVNLTIHETANCENPIKPPLKKCLKERVHIKATMLAKPKGYRLYLDRCWTTSHQAKTSNPITLIGPPSAAHGQPVPAETAVFNLRKDDRAVCFSFQAFQYIPSLNPDEACRVYVHCDIIACCCHNQQTSINDPSPICQDICSGSQPIDLGDKTRRRKKRDVEGEELPLANETLYTRVTIGPLVLDPPAGGECKPLVEIEKGMIECSNGYREASNCAFKCDAGYFLSGLKPGQDTIRCNRPHDRTNDSPKWSDSEPSCKDINECATEDDPCRRGVRFSTYKCINTPGSYRCECRPGYAIHPVSPWKCSPGKTYEGSITVVEPSLATFGKDKFEALIHGYLMTIYGRLVSQSMIKITVKTTRVEEDAGSFPWYQVKNVTAVTYDVFMRTDDDLFRPPAPKEFSRKLVAMLKIEDGRKVEQGKLCDGCEVLIKSGAANIVLHDKDECTAEGANDCSANADCKNNAGSYDCSCKFGFEDVVDDELEGRLCGAVGYKKMLKYWSSVFVDNFDHGEDDKFYY